MVSNLVSGILVSSFAISAPFAVAVLDVAPLYASTHGAGTIVVDRAAEGIGNAFASLPQICVDPAIAPAATRASKGDLPRTADCTGATWPKIAASCLSTVDGSPTPHVRTITIGYQAGANTTVIARIPAEELTRH
jgi:hypothetical protein